MLARVAPSPVVDLNRAVALAQVAGPAAGLAAVDALAADPAMVEYRFFHATRADFLRRLGRWGEAADAYARALALSGESSRAGVPRGAARGRGCAGLGGVAASGSAAGPGVRLAVGTSHISPMLLPSGSFVNAIQSSYARVAVDDVRLRR